MVNFKKRILVSVVSFVFPALTMAATSVLVAEPGRNAYLRTNERMTSPSGNVTMVMQSDGDLVVYDSRCVMNPQCAIWSSNTYGHVPSQFFLAIQEDGNLVIYRGTPEYPGSHIWSSGSHGAFGTYYLVLQDDTNLVIYSEGDAQYYGHAVWSSLNQHARGHKKQKPNYYRDYKDMF